MTLIIGVKCEDSVVIGADSIRTYGSRIEQEVSNKIQIVDDDILIGTSGAVGLSQLIKDELSIIWTRVKKQRRISSARTIISDAMLAQISPARNRADKLKNRFEGCRSIIALPLQDNHVLLQYDAHANSVEISDESPFISIGSGSFQAAEDRLRDLSKRFRLA